MTSPITTIMKHSESQVAGQQGKTSHPLAADQCRRPGRPPGLRGEQAQPWQFLAVREEPAAAGPPGPAGAARPAGDQVVDEQENSRSDDGGEPGREVEEALQGMDGEGLGGGPDGGQCREQTVNVPCDNAHTDSKASH